MKTIIKFTLLVVSTILFSAHANGQCSEFETINLKKIAIVFGEKDYKYAGALTNPLNDAQDISDSLKQLGFFVVTYSNSDFKTMTTAIDDWYTKIDKYDVALFYYSGHGAEVNGENYLFPVDANPKGISDLHYMAYSANRVLANMETRHPKYNIMILDACRNNPFTKSWNRGVRDGLSPMTGKGSFIGFAASPGTVASDGQRRNGTYTEAILKYITVPNSSIDQIFTKVNAYVRKESRESQIPYKNSSLSSDFCFSIKSDSPSNNFTKSTIVQPASGIYLSSIDEKIFTGDSLNKSVLLKNSKTLNNIATIEYGNIHPYKITARNGTNVYVIDTTIQAFFILDSRKNTIKSKLPLQFKPISIAISTDERKAYITNYTDTSSGSISVIDIVQNKVIKSIDTQQPVTGLAISPVGKLLYVTSQCNSGKKALLIIDAKTDKILNSIEGFSCGEAIGVSSDNRNIYVSTVGEGGINQINVIDANSLKVQKTLDIKTRSFAFTSDSKFLFALGDSEVIIIRTEDNSIINKLPFATTPYGIAASDDGRVYVWLPLEYRTFVFPLLEYLQGPPTIDLEANLKKFKEEQIMRNSADIQYRIVELVNKTTSVLIAGTHKLAQELGANFQPFTRKIAPNYKELFTIMDIGIWAVTDSSKNIDPTYEARFTQNLFILTVKEKGQEEIFKTSINEIDWDKVEKFVREYLIKKLNQLR